MSQDPVFARRVFFWAGVLGLVGLVPQYFAEGLLAQLAPPAMNHPEHFYAFLGVAIGWQVGFLFIARDPRRLRPVMPAAALEKILFSGSQFACVFLGRAAATQLAVAVFDAVFATLFLVAWKRTPD